MVYTSKRDITEEYAVLNAQLKKAKSRALSERELGELKKMYGRLESVGLYEKQIPEYKQVMHEFATIFEHYDAKKTTARLERKKQGQENLQMFHQQLGGYLDGRVSLNQVLKDTPQIFELYARVKNSKAYQENPEIARKIDQRVNYIVVDKFGQEAKYRLGKLKDVLEEKIFAKTMIPSPEFPYLPAMKKYSSEELEQLEAQKWAKDLENVALPRPPRDFVPVKIHSVKSEPCSPTLEEDLGYDFPRMSRFLEQCVLLGSVFEEPRVRNKAIEALKKTNPYFQNMSYDEVALSCNEEPWPNPEDIGRQAKEWEEKIKVNDHHLNGARPVYRAIQAVETLANHNILSPNSLRVSVRRVKAALREKVAEWYHDISKYF